MPTRAITSRSRSVSPASAPSAAGSLERAANSAMRPAGHPGREERVALDHRPHGTQEFRRFGVLDQEAGGTGADRLEDVLVELEGGEHDHPHVLEAGVPGDAPGRGETVEQRHADVHQDDVRPQFAHLAHRLLAVGGLPRHLDVRLRVEQGPETGPHE
ncbi:hypothetical protein M2163_002099 [Streptomyces sp. SAI-135]|nr:hypothetical protein [Streptomyces sp. SAI-135]